MANLPYRKVRIRGKAFDLIIEAYTYKLSNPGIYSQEKSRDMLS